MPVKHTRRKKGGEKSAKENFKAYYETLKKKDKKNNLYNVLYVILKELVYILILRDQVVFGNILKKIIVHQAIVNEFPDIIETVLKFIDTNHDINIASNILGKIKYIHGENLSNIIQNIVDYLHTDNHKIAINYIMDKLNSDKTLRKSIFSYFQVLINVEFKKIQELLDNLSKKNGQTGGLGIKIPSPLKNRFKRGIKILKQLNPLKKRRQTLYKVSDDSTRKSTTNKKNEKQRSSEFDSDVVFYNPQINSPSTTSRTKQVSLSEITINHEFEYNIDPLYKNKDIEKNINVNTEDIDNFVEKFIYVIFRILYKLNSVYPSIAILKIIEDIDNNINLYMDFINLTKTYVYIHLQYILMSLQNDQENKYLKKIQGILNSQRENNWIFQLNYSLENEDLKFRYAWLKQFLQKYDTNINTILQDLNKNAHLVIEIVQNIVLQYILHQENEKEKTQNKENNGVDYVFLINLIIQFIDGYIKSHDKSTSKSVFEKLTGIANVLGLVLGSIINYQKIDAFLKQTFSEVNYIDELNKKYVERHKEYLMKDINNIHKMMISYLVNKTPSLYNSDVRIPRTRNSTHDTSASMSIRRTKQSHRS